MQYLNYITSTPAVMLGKPVIKDTRITVDFVLKRLSEGISPGDLIEAYPNLTPAAIDAALAYAADMSAN